MADQNTSQNPQGEMTQEQIEAKKAEIAKSDKIELLKKTAKNYVPAIGTETDYHARIEVKSFDQSTGERKSTPSLQTFSPGSWKGFSKNSASLGYTVDILHDPTGEYPKVGVQPKEKKEQK